LQVSKIAKDQTDHALSSDLVERALFTFGRAAQSLFATKLSHGKARLEFERPENREFWLAGYQYIKSLIMKGTYRTALEWAKLLLALDPENDPYCMLLMIHHLSLRAYESQYLLDIYESQMLGEWSTLIAYVSPSLALAAMQLREPVRARKLLEQSIQRLPWIFCKLFQELNLNNPPPSIWGAEPRTDAENLFSEIYIRQTKDLWNTP
jgi:tetratricopeptide (TPR) repeat protein